jgi:hypothetical protein
MDSFLIPSLRFPETENDLSVRNIRMKHSLLPVYFARRDRVSEKLRIRWLWGTFREEWERSDEQDTITA